MPDVLLVSGTGPYVDPWHDFAATSARLAAVVEDLGHHVEIATDVEVALAEPSARLLIVNIGNPTEPRPRELMDNAAAGLERHLTAGGGLLGVHSSSTSLIGMRQWPAILGGRWVRGTSMHPPRGPFVARRTPATHPISQDLPEIELVDERYSHLETQPGVTVLYEHELEGTSHPLVWAHEPRGGRVAYSAFGHDIQAYESTAHIELLRRAIHWMM